MKIMMIGRGVIATIYGWVFTQAGHSVTHLVRSGKSGQLSLPINLDLLDTRAAPGGASGKTRGLTGVYRAHCIENLDGLADFDLAVVSVRHDQAEVAVRHIAAAPQPRAGTLLFNNCWEDPAALSGLLPRGRAIWGFPVAGGGFGADGGFDQLSGSILANVHLAAPDPDNAALHRAVRELLEHNGFEVEEHRDMKAWLWRHFAVNTGLVAQGLARDLDAASLIASPRQVAGGIRLGREALKVALARGMDPKAESGESAVLGLPGFIAGRLIPFIAKSQPAVRRIMTQHANPAELARFPLDVLAEARRLGIDCPMLSSVEAKARTVAGN